MGFPKREEPKKNTPLKHASRPEPTGKGQIKLDNKDFKEAVMGRSKLPYKKPNAKRDVCLE